MTPVRLFLYKLAYNCLYLIEFYFVDHDEKEAYGYDLIMDFRYFALLYALICYMGLVK